MFPLWNFFLEKKQFSTILVAGSLLSHILRDHHPQGSPAGHQYPVGSVSVSFPGASAEDVESLVTNPLEEQIVNIGDIDTLTSTSKDGSASIRVQFDASANITQAIQNLRDAVSKSHRRCHPR